MIIWNEKQKSLLVLPSEVATVYRFLYFILGNKYTYTYFFLKSY